MMRDFVWVDDVLDIVEDNGAPSESMHWIWTYNHSEKSWNHCGAEIQIPFEHLKVSINTKPDPQDTGLVRTL